VPPKQSTHKDVVGLVEEDAEGQSSGEAHLDARVINMVAERGAELPRLAAALGRGRSSRAPHGTVVQFDEVPLLLLPVVLRRRGTPGVGVGVGVGGMMMVMVMMMMVMVMIDDMGWLHGERVEEPWSGVCGLLVDGAWTHHHHHHQQQQQLLSHAPGGCEEGGWQLDHQRGVGGEHDVAPRVRVVQHLAAVALLCDKNESVVIVVVALLCGAVRPGEACKPVGGQSSLQEECFVTTEMTLQLSGCRDGSWYLL
jgi:hypothetical protein